MRKALRLWVACRFIESRWRCWADPDVHTEDYTAEFPQDPFWDHTSLPPYVDYQWASIVIQRVLVPLRDEILKDLERMVERHKPEDWYATFLTAFILLQNYELQMRFQRDFARRRNAQVSLEANCTGPRKVGYLTGPACSIDIWTCVSCAPQTQEPRPSSPISTTAAKVSNHLDATLIGVRQSFARWPD